MNWWRTQEKVRAQLRKNLVAPLITHEQLIDARQCFAVDATKRNTKRGRERDNALIELLVKHPGIKDPDGADRMKIGLDAYRKRKRRLLDPVLLHFWIDRESGQKTS